MGSLEKVFGEGPPKLWEKVGFLEDFFFLGGKDPQDSGKSWDLWGRNSKKVGKMGSLEIFFWGGKDHQDSGKSWDLLNFFFWRGGGKDLQDSGKSWDLLRIFFWGKDPQDSGKNWDLWRNFLGEGPPR